MVTGWSDLLGAAKQELRLGTGRGWERARAEDSGVLAAGGNGR